MVQIGNEWDTLLEAEFTKPYYLRLRSVLAQEYQTRTVYPDMYDIFNALRYTPYSEVKAVILGQDPYHGPGQAHGLCFSVRQGMEPPPSLKNIFQEIQEELGIQPPPHGELTSWARSGCAVAQHRPDRPGRTGQQSPGSGMGNLHRPGH